MTETDGMATPGTAQEPREIRGLVADATPEARADALVSAPTVSMIGFLIVTMVIGYEWFMSGLVKFVRGDFPSGLADELLAKTAGTSDWYGGFLKSVAIPFGEPFGYVLETSEVLAGIALIVGPLIWLFAWDRVSHRLRLAVLFFMAVAAIGGAFLAINLHLANGASHPWLIPGDSFDEGIDLDSVLPAISVVIAAVSIILFRRVRRGEHQG
jgi:uncharacterized membrane protein YphA (DoxX/SURF4 family)